LFMTLLAAFQLLLARYTNQAEVVTGTPIANRRYAELEQLIGFFVNTLVLRSDLSGDPTFTELLARVREVCLGAYAHQDVPFEKLVEELQPERSLAQTPLFQVMFTLQNMPQEAFALPGLSVSMLAVEGEATKFDLSFAASELDGQLFCSLHYKTALFAPETIKRMAGHFETLLKGIVANPEAHLSALPLLPAPEATRMLVEWNETDRDYALTPSLHELFDAQAAATPAARAVVHEAEHLTYAELNARANQLAHHLRALGVGPETLVGLLVDRSPEMIVGLLGIVKAGGAYVPLDPALPQERLALMLADARVPVLVTQARYADKVGAHEAALVLLDADWPRIAKLATTPPPNRTRPENAAYIIYTSGSTGRPKGVVVEQRQILNYVRAITERVGLERGASFAMVQPLTVDSTQTLLFPVFLSGGTLHLISREHSVEADALADYFQRHAIDFLKIAPSHLAALHTSARAAELMPRRWLVIGGEASRREWVAERQQLAPGCAIFNHYGPTETTVGMMMHRFDADASPAARSVFPIGRPLANTTTYVLDRHMRPVPVGVHGELYVGGACVARGYLAQPDKTAERFIPDPFARTPGARLYRTGDVVRQLPDGTLVFIGRSDNQVKIRGFRIELGEIEATLRRHAGVSEALVTARESAGGERRLAAYVVLTKDEPDQPSADDLLAYLKERLPDYMIPSALVILDALPLSAHGKIDLQKLPAPEAAQGAERADYVAPRNPTEQQLAHIWEELLGVKPVSVTANFFELGGHSLLAVRMMASVHKRMGRQLPLVTLFAGATIEQLAHALDSEALPAETGTPLVALQPHGTQTPLCCVHEIGGGVMEYVHLARHLGADRPFYALRATGGGRAESVTEMAARYVAALRAERPAGPYLIGGWSFGGLVAHAMAVQLRAQQQQVAALCLFDSVAPGWLALQPAAATHDGDDPRALAEDIWRLLGRAVPDALRELDRLAPEAQTERLFAYARAAQIVPDEIERADFMSWLAGYRARLRAARAYVPQQYDGRVALFRASELADADRRAFAAQLGDDPTYGWGKYCGRLAVYDVPGAHHTILLEPHVQVLAQKLKGFIAGE
ncbi:MAG TPA: amino acid adenylation domain-containing protein, partial [Pyrinomonadaceae bacterium]